MIWLIRHDLEGLGLDVRLSDVLDVSTRILQLGSFEQDEPFCEPSNSWFISRDSICQIITVVSRN